VNRDIFLTNSSTDVIFKPWLGNAVNICEDLGEKHECIMRARDEHASRNDWRLLPSIILLALISLAMSGCGAHHLHGHAARHSLVDGQRFALAQALLAAGAPDEAVRVLSVMEAVDQPAFHALMGRSALLAGHDALGAHHLRLAAQLGTDDWRVYSALGVLSARDGEDDAALSYFAKAERASPNQPAVLNNAALVHMRRDRPERAVALLRQALIHPQDDDPQIARNLQAAQVQLARSLAAQPPRHMAAAGPMTAWRTEIRLSAEMRPDIY
jgi:Flp pilus assembly protein TadD